MKPKRVKAVLRAAGVTYRQVAEVAGTSWHWIYLVVNGRKTSARVVAVMEQLTGQRIGRIERRRQP